MKEKAFSEADACKQKIPSGGTESAATRTKWARGYRRLRRYVAGIAASNDDPHFIAMGIAVGVFVGCTPTMPFHTLFAVSLAFLLQGSKAAAALGVWVCNPLTFPFLYLGSYKIGYRLLGAMLPFPIRAEWLPEILKTGFDTTLLMVVGGLVIGIVPAFISYFVSRKIASALKARKTLIKETLHLKPAQSFPTRVDR